MKHTQQQKILALLQQAGSSGVSSYDLTYKFHIKQAPTRIYELKELGYLITTRKKTNKEIDYILISNSHASIPTTTASAEPQEEVLIRVEHESGMVTWEKPGYLIQKGLGI